MTPESASLSKLARPNTCPVTMIITHVGTAHHFQRPQSSTQFLPRSSLEMCLVVGDNGSAHAFQNNQVSPSCCIRQCVWNSPQIQARTALPVPDNEQLCLACTQAADVTNQIETPLVQCQMEGGHISHHQLDMTGLISKERRSSKRSLQHRTAWHREAQRNRAQHSP